MANIDQPFGFRFHSSDAGSAPLQMCIIPSADGTATFRNDAVKPSSAGSSTSGAGGVAPAVIQAAATDPVFGVIEGFLPHYNEGATLDLSTKHRLASTAMYCLVRPCLRGDTYVVQEDAVGGAVAAADIGLNYDIVVGSGSTTTGISAMELDSSSGNTTATLQLRLRGFLNASDNEIAVANQDLVVSFNNISLGGSTGVAGV